MATTDLRQTFPKTTPVWPPWLKIFFVCELAQIDIWTLFCDFLACQIPQSSVWTAAAITKC
jgi:hypothetical protein